MFFRKTASSTCYSSFKYWSGLYPDVLFDVVWNVNILCHYVFVYLHMCLCVGRVLRVRIYQFLRECSYVCAPLYFNVADYEWVVSSLLTLCSILAATCHISAMFSKTLYFAIACCCNWTDCFLSSLNNFFKLITDRLLDLRHRFFYLNYLSHCEEETLI